MDERRRMCDRDVYCASALLMFSSNQLLSHVFVNWILHLCLCYLKQFIDIQVFYSSIYNQMTDGIRAREKRLDWTKLINQLLIYWIQTNRKHIDCHMK